MISRIITDIRVLEDLSRSMPCDEGFIRLKRLMLQNRYDNGEESRPYRCDMVLRLGMDAVAVTPFSVDEAGMVWVYLVRCLRPVVYLRPENPEESPYLLEVVAGIIEPEDPLGFPGVAMRAALETAEEAGFSVDPSRIIPLGPPLYATPGANTEKLHYVAVRVDPASGVCPTGDGSVYEQDSAVVRMSLEDALALLETGGVKDAKTEIALTRLRRFLNSDEGRATAGMEVPA